ncbi:MAG: type II toxin-antitoxin system HipA family toxin [Mariprofundaceae bacterium]
MSKAKSKVDVFMYGFDIPVGTLFFNRNTFTFGYAEEWTQQGFPLTPIMPLDSKTHYSKGLHPIFSDVAPDRWGRKLIDKKLVEAGHKGTVLEQHYLLELSDEMRMGALRFSFDGGKTFMGVKDDILPITALAKFVRLTDAMINGEVKDYTVLFSNVSLGGARAKLMIQDQDKRFKLAKLPQPNDVDDVEGWEFVLLRLAENAGIDVPVTSLHGDKTQHALLLERFDRDGDRRIHYMSAMTLLEMSDGDSDDSSYVDLADAMSSICEVSCIKQLFRRMVFNVMCGNVDDHLRNHGFLYIDGIWKLSPAFDMTPCDDYGSQHALHVYDKNTPDTFETIMVCCEHFGLHRDEALEIISKVAEAVSGWREIAKANEVRGINYMGNRFAWERADQISK